MDNGLKIFRAVGIFGLVGIDKTIIIHKATVLVCP